MATGTTFRVKRNFTAGELSPLMYGRTDNKRYENGSKRMHNMYSKPQGPAVRRPGTAFVFDLTPLVGEAIPGSHAQGRVQAVTNRPRLVPFIVDEDTSYMLCFYPYTSGTTRIIFLAEHGVVEDSGSPGNPYVFEITGTFDLENFRYAQSGDVLYITQVGRAPLELIRVAQDDWTINEVVFIEQPPDWGVDDWPRLVTFFEQRITYHANATRPNTTWMSKSGDFYDFGQDSPPLESDALTFTLDSGRQNRIQWVSSARQLLMGTLGDEWAIDGAAGQPLSYLTIDADKQTAHGSEDLIPIQIGSAILFIERLGRVANMFIFDFNVNGWTVSDLSILAPHFTEEHSLQDWAHAHTPNSIVWCIRNDGHLLGLTFQREHNVIAWHDHTTDGKFLAVGCMPCGTCRETDTWAVVWREVDSVNKWYIERLESEFISGDYRDSRFLDSHLVYDGVPTDTVGNLDHLEAKTVQPLADGAPHPPVVVTGGQITLDKEYSHVVVGIPYASQLRPLLNEEERRDGTSTGRVYRLSKLLIGIYNSLGMKISRINNDDGETITQEVPFRKPADLTGTPIPPFTGYKEVDFPEGYARSMDIEIEQLEPLPLTVIGMVDEYKVFR